MITWEDQEIRLMLLEDEGMRLKPYVDTVGKVTIGVGRNLTDVGISQKMAFQMLEEDLEIVKRELVSIFGEEFLESIGEFRKAALVSMLFNLGKPRFLGFKKMIAAIQQKDFKSAAQHALDSKWAKQVGNRSHRAAYRLEHDKEELCF